MMKVFITGGTGFVGLNLVEKLVNKGHTARVLVRTSSPSERLPDEAETVTGDITDPSSYQAALEEAEVAVHLAALLYGDNADYDRFLEVNFEATKQLLQHAEQKDISKFVFLNTAQAHPQTNDTRFSPYARSKRKCNELFSEDERSIDYTVLYPTGIIGPQDYRLIRYNLFNRVNSNLFLFPPLYMPGTYNLVHVDDVVRAIHSSFNGLSNEKSLITGENLTSKALYRKINSVSGSDCRVIPVPTSVTNNVLIRTVNILHNRGLFPEEVSAIEKRDKLVPDHLTTESPVTQNSIKKALNDAWRWYSKVGLLE
jgi:dihydroflavonol-4-reductase